MSKKNKQKKQQNSGRVNTVVAVEQSASEAVAPKVASVEAVQPLPVSRKPSGFSNLLLHLHPRMVNVETLKLERTFGLGGMALLLFFVLILSGALLMFVYEPNADRAYASVTALTRDVPFGTFVRSIHHWAGNGLLVVAVLHLLRVFYTGAFLPPRRFNWNLGLILLAVVMAANFTGYLLPWDQLSYWAVTIATGMLEYVPVVGDAMVRGMRGGTEVGAKTLSLFFVMHIALLPILFFLLTSFHFWKVRKAGGVMVPNQEGRRPVMVPVQPNLTVREGVAALVLLAVLFLISAIFSAPLQDQANPGMSPNPAKAPWYFMGIQELLIHLHPAFTVLAIPLIGIAFLIGFPYLRYVPPPSGQWFHSSQGRTFAMRSAIAAVILVPLAVLDEFTLHWAKIFPGLAPEISTGLIPLLFWLACFSGILYILVRRASRIEAVQATLTFAAVGLVALTLIGIFFRGESMRLVWP
jgi:quinol-cytochrome oxidoreductase complex cytochrome b subunit